jgi:hypothetical protein
MRKKLMLGLAISLTCCKFCCAVETDEVLYTYPVAIYSSAGATHVLVLYQYTHKRELYDVHGDFRYTKMLMAWYNPAGVVLLPDLSGFSFVDNGRIRLKHFEKRSVRSLEIYEPIYGIELVHWLDNQTCYFHAPSHGHYALYTLSLDEILTCLISDKYADYMYPSHIGTTLFFIECIEIDGCSRYNFCKIAVDTSVKEKNNLICLGNLPHIMLRMYSPTRGAVLVDKGSNGKLFFFEYVELYNQAGVWHTKFLFKFSISKKLLSYGPARVYESLLPFVPKEVGSRIYFSSFNDKHDCMTLYYYDKKTYNINILVEKEVDLFVPVIRGTTCCYGGAVSSIEFLNINELEPRLVD